MLFSAVITVVAVFVLLYVSLTVPAVQDRIRAEAETALSELLGGRVGIGSLTVYPFNEVVLGDVVLSDPQGRRCLDAATVGAGISLWSLLTDGRVEITYVELLDFKASIWQDSPESPLNIDFIIRALSPKDKNKPPAKFDLAIRNIVIRGGSLSFSRRWLKRKEDPGCIDFNHIDLRNLRADVALPRLCNDSVVVDLRRLAFSEGDRLTVKKIAATVSYTPTSLAVKGLEIELPNTSLAPADMFLAYDSPADIGKSLASGHHRLVIESGILTPSDFSGLYPPLAGMTEPLSLSLSASGNSKAVDIENLDIANRHGSHLAVRGGIKGMDDMSGLSARLDCLDFQFKDDFLKEMAVLLPDRNSALSDIYGRMGSVEGLVSGSFAGSDGHVVAEGFLGTSLGRVDFDITAHIPKDNLSVAGHVVTDGFDLGGLLAADDIGTVAFSADADVTIAGCRFPDGLSGDAGVDVSYVELRGTRLENVSVSASKNGKEMQAVAKSDNPGTDFSATLAATLDGARSRWHADINVDEFDTYSATLTDAAHAWSFAGRIFVDACGDKVDNLTGQFRLDDVDVVRPDGRSLHLHRLLFTSDCVADYSGTGRLPMRNLQLNADFMHAYAQGDFLPSKVPAMVKYAIANAIPSLLQPAGRQDFGGSGIFSVTIDVNDRLTEFFGIPIKPLTPLEISGRLDGENADAELSVSLPYLLKGRDKLVRDISVKASMHGDEGRAKAEISLVYPAKKGDVGIDLSIEGFSDIVDLDIDFNRGLKSMFYGSMSMNALFSKNIFDGGTEAKIHVKPSSFVLNDAEWKLGEADISYAENRLEINGLSLRHDGQFVLIDGKASSEHDDILSLRLADIDLSYIFDTLNINYVTFGGVATGSLAARNLFTARPEAYTEKLSVKGLSYNGGVLGDGELTSYFDAGAKRIAIKADIREGERRRALVDGGIWLGRDSLAFDIDADKVDIRFLQPFMQAFSSRVEGRASGKARLYGTFKDIDLTGRLKADTISMLVDYTNVVYCGSDSVIMEPGIIRIPSFRLYDRYGHSGLLQGEVRHSYFHDPVFRFDVAGVRDMLCFETNASINPDWYGTIFGSGTARISGRPGVVEVFADMRTEQKSVFTFVLSDWQQAADYNFLTFTDRRKEQTLRDIPLEEKPDYVKILENKVRQEQGPPSIFSLDLRVTATPSARMVIVMDPVAGDKITAYGNGAMNITYSSDDDEMKMYGRYILERGTYNFSLQDIILKDFTIKPGSEISFTGNPLAAQLDLTAAYKVNTSLTDLDESFASDRELNRTNVPVEALLKVKGVMTNPDISFDIELPTLTEETRRKVRSIISTEDLMSRQVIYLLALNRFYTPEYMGNSSNGGEWASVASSTLSSQLQNVLGQLTDKFTVAPSLRSDSGDFSDLEVDVALSSALLNNRLLINGNFGYRDKSTSNTTFVGDFDIEYLLNRGGNLRLKAYNHFNDQNYYLKSALTTQGIGIVYRRDFDNLFAFLKRRRRKLLPAVPVVSDSIPADTVR